MLASTLACTTAADALVNYRGYVPQRLSVNSPLPRWDVHMFARMLAGRRCLCLGWHGDLLVVHHHWQHSYCITCSCSKLPIAPHACKLPIAPMGKLLTRLPRLPLQQLRPTHRSTTGGTCRRDLKSSHRPMGIPADLPNRLSSFNSDRYLVLSGISTCQPRLQTSHRPDGKIADVLALTHACTTANTSVNYSMYVPQRPSKVPIAPMGKCLAPMGFSHVLRLCLQGGGVYVRRGTVSFLSCTITGNSATSVRAHAQKFPSLLT